MPSIDYVKELAFYYYSRIHKGPEFAIKGYKCYKHIYNKTLEIEPNKAELLYYWHALTLCKYESQGYIGSVSEIEKLINWELTPSFLTYREHVTDGYWLKLRYHCQMDDIEGFQSLYKAWYNRMIPLETTGKPRITPVELVNPISIWLLQKDNVELPLEYILENGYLFYDKGVLNNEELDIVKRIKMRLSV